MLFLVNVHTDPSDPISTLFSIHEGLQQVWFFPLSNNVLYLYIGSMSSHDISETKKKWKLMRRHCHFRILFLFF